MTGNSVIVDYWLIWSYERIYVCDHQWHGYLRTGGTGGHSFMLSYILRFFNELWPIITCTYKYHYLNYRGNILQCVASFCTLIKCWITSKKYSKLLWFSFFSSGERQLGGDNVYIFAFLPSCSSHNTFIETTTFMSALKWTKKWERSSDVKFLFFVKPVSQLLIHDHFLLNGYYLLKH